MDALILSLLIMTTANAAPAPVKPVARPVAKPVAKPAPKNDRPQARVLQPQRRAPVPTPARKSFPAIELYEVNLNETLQYQPFDERGRARKQSLAELTRFMRCHHTGKQHRVDERLAHALYVVGRHYAGRRIEVFSGYRPKAFCTRAHSRHLTASAVDFRIDGVKNEALVAWLRSTFHPSGVGYYPNGVHVHLDLDRDHDTYWIDPGDAPTVDEPGDGSDAIGELLRHNGPIVVGDDARAVEAAGDEASGAVPLPAAPAPLPAVPAEEPSDPPLSDPRFVE
jgi:uncharacterized protein YcbK (DUF882 family)